MGAGASSPNEFADFKRDVLHNIKICGHEQGAKRLQALKELEAVAKQSQYRAPLCESSNLIPTMVHILEKSMQDVEAVEVCTKILIEISNEHGCRKTLGSKKIRLIPALLNAVVINDTVQINCGIVLMNVALEKATHDYLLSSEFSLLEFLNFEIHAAVGNPLLYFDCLQSLLTEIEERFIPQIIDLKFHEFLMKKIINGPPVIEDWSDIGKCCLNILLYMSRFRKAADAIRKVEGFEVLYNFLNDNNLDGMKVIFLIANCCGLEEGNNEMKSLLEHYPKVLLVTRYCFSATIAYDPASELCQNLMANGFVLGNIPLNIIASVLKNLSLNDNHKMLILKEQEIIMNVLIAIQAFIDNAPPFGGMYEGIYRPAGGGGDDLFALENFLELLLQLSFYYQDKDSLMSWFNQFGKLNIISVLKDLLHLPDGGRLSSSGKQLGLQLYSRYFPKPKEIPPSNSRLRQSVLANAPTEEPLPSHIMLSYAPGVKTENVIALANQLRGLGYDVWRDVEGSAIIDPVNEGEYAESIAAAILYASVVVICVTPEYKDNSNCRLEAKQAQEKANQDSLKIVYVMLDEDYHTTSVPKQVNGWLAFMIGIEPWYPLWDIENQLLSTAKTITHIAGEKSLVANNMTWVIGHIGKMNHSDSNISPKRRMSIHKMLSNTPMIAETKSEVHLGEKLAEKSHSNSAPSSSDDPYVAAWQCLDVNKVNHGTILQGLLQDLGLDKPNDLKSLDTDHILVLSLTMKRPQQKIFLDLIHKFPCPLYEVDHHLPLERYQEAWKETDGKKVKLIKGFLAAQDELGITKPEDLRILEGPELALIALTLRKPVQKPFCEALGLKLH